MEKRFHIAPTLEKVATVTDDIQKFLSDKTLSDKSSFALELTLEEILTNIIKYSSTDEKDITIVVIKEDENYTLKFYYSGDFFDPTLRGEIDRTQSLEERSIGGLGLGMVKNFVKDMDYTHLDNINTLTIKINYE